MKIDEFIKEVNEVAYAQYNGGVIEIYWTETMGSIHSIGAFMTLNPSEQSLNESHDWDELNRIRPENLLRVLSLVRELQKTPVEKRFPEKKYRLIAIPDALKEFGDETIKYVHQINATWGSFQFVFGEPTVFSESVLKEIEKSYPMMKPSIEAMKEEAKDDE